jgi:hypothetical protein
VLVRRSQPGEVFLQAIVKRYRIELDEQEWGQLLDELECRAESWKRTAEYLRTEELPDGEFFVIKECRDEEEAEEIAACYEGIIRNIKSQMEVQP